MIELREKYAELSKKPKAFRPNKLFKERALLREQALAIESERLSKGEPLKTDPLES